MLDMNCDNMICETDLFTYLELHNKDDDHFSKCMIYDIQDIGMTLQERN